MDLPSTGSAGGKFCFFRLEGHMPWKSGLVSVYKWLNKNVWHFSLAFFEERSITNPTNPTQPNQPLYHFDPSHPHTSPYDPGGKVVATLRLDSPVLVAAP